MIKNDSDKVYKFFTAKKNWMINKEDNIFYEEIAKMSRVQCLIKMYQDLPVIPETLGMDSKYQSDTFTIKKIGEEIEKIKGINS